MTDIKERLRGVATLLTEDELWYPTQASFVHEAAARIEALEKALEPFANVGRVIAGPFGPALFQSENEAFKSGCAWTENGVKKTLTWGDFRRATQTKEGER